MCPCILCLNDNHIFICWLSVGFVTFLTDLFIRNVALSATKNLIQNLIKPTVQKCVMYVKCTTHLWYLSCTLKCHYLTSECIPIFIITESNYLFQVIQIPVANCSSRTDCSSCLDNNNPLCGWCVVENKCSKRTQCQNPDSKWIQATKDPSQCPTITVSPQQFDLEDPQNVVKIVTILQSVQNNYPYGIHAQLTLTLSQPLPPLLVNETYLCHFTSGTVQFTVEAMGSGTIYTCNITGVIPSEFDRLLSTGE